MSTGDFPVSLDQRTRTRFETYSKEAMKNVYYKLYMDVQNTSVFSEAYVDDEGGVSVGLLTEDGAVTYTKDNEGRQTFLVADVYAGKVKDNKHERLRARDESTLFSKFLSKRVDKAIIKMKQQLEISAAGVLNDAFAGASVVAPDTNAIIGAHTFKNGVSFNNQSPTNIAAGVDAMAEIEAYGGAFKDADNKEYPIEYDTILVKTGGSAAVAFKKVFKENGVKPTTVDGVNIYDDGRYKLIEIPYITDPKAWIALASMEDNPFILDIVEAPTMGERTHVGDEKYEQNATAAWKTGCVSMPVGVYGSNGSGVAS